MSKIKLDIDDKIISELGKDKINEIFLKSLKNCLMKIMIKRISQSIDLSRTDYDKELSKIRVESWKEYKKEIL